MDIINWQDTSPVAVITTAIPKILSSRIASGSLVGCNIYHSM